MASPDPRKDLKSRSPERRDPHYYKGYFIRAPLRDLFFRGHPGGLGSVCFLEFRIPSGASSRLLIFKAELRNAKPLNP